MLQFYYMYAYNLCYYYTVAAQQARKIVIAHPGQGVELSCSLGETTENRKIIAWKVDNVGPYTVNSLRNGILIGYSAHTHSTSIIIQNIMMNDRRNGTEYYCVIITNSNVVLQESDTVFQLYVAGEFQHNIRRWILLML